MSNVLSGVSAIKIKTLYLFIVLCKPIDLLIAILATVNYPKQTGFHSVTNLGIVPIQYTEWRPELKNKHDILNSNNHLDYDNGNFIPT